MFQEAGEMNVFDWKIAWEYCNLIGAFPCARQMFISWPLQNVWNSLPAALGRRVHEHKLHHQKLKALCLALATDEPLRRVDYSRCDRAFWLCVSIVGSLVPVYLNTTVLL